MANTPVQPGGHDNAYDQARPIGPTPEVGRQLHRLDDALNRLYAAGVHSAARIADATTAIGVGTGAAEITIHRGGGHPPAPRTDDDGTLHDPDLTRLRADDRALAKQYARAADQLEALAGRVEDKQHRDTCADCAAAAVSTAHHAAHAH